VLATYTGNSTFRFEAVNDGEQHYIQVRARTVDGEITIPWAYNTPSRFQVPYWAFAPGKSSTELFNPQDVWESGWPGPSYYNYTRGDRFILVSLIPNSSVVSVPESHVLRFNNFVSDSNGINRVNVELKNDGGWVTICSEKRAGDICSAGSIGVKILSVSSYPDRTVGYKTTPGWSRNVALQKYVGTFYRVIYDVNGYHTSLIYVQDVAPTIFAVNNSRGELSQEFRGSIDEAGVISVECVSGCQTEPPQPPQVCSELIAKKGVVYPASVEGYVFQRSDEEREQDLVDLGDATEYSAEYEHPITGNRIVTYTYVFDNADVNISASELIQEEVKRELPWSGGALTSNLVDNQYYSLSENDGTAYLWFNKNVLVLVGIQKKGAPEAISVDKFISKLQDNGFDLVDISNEDGHTLAQVAFGYLALCPSTVQERCYPLWGKKVEPVVCPPHGYKDVVYSDRNNCATEPINLRSQLKCSPGMCSGCYVPRWLGYDTGDNVCIPYGTRLAFENSDRERLTEADAAKTDDYKLVISPDGNSAVLTLIYEQPAGNRTGTARDYTLAEGQTITIEDPEGGQVTFRVEGINYGTSAEQRYVDFTVITGFDAYCNYNGNIQEQKVRNTDGSWASCQNNYECESNFCSGGQCVEINQLIGQASAFKGFFVRTLCRLSNLFDDDGYNACIGQYLG